MSLVKIFENNEIVFAEKFQFFHEFWRSCVKKGNVLVSEFDPVEGLEGIFFF